MSQTHTFRGVETTTYMNDNELVGVYRGTPVAKKLGNRIVLNTGGWLSRTTKTRMNQFSNNFCGGAFSVYQKDYSWFIKVRGSVLPFNDSTITFEV